MAIKDSKGFIHGVIGDFVFRVVNGKQIVQQRPKTSKISQKTKENGVLFGRVSKQAAEIRGRLKPWLGSNYDSKMTGRFLGSCLKIINASKESKTELLDLYTVDLSELKGFEFNIHSLVSKYFIGRIEILGDLKTGLEFRLPKIITICDIRYPRRCENVDLHLIVMHIPENSISNFSVFSSQWTLPKSDIVQEERSFHVMPIQTTGVTLAIMQLSFFDSYSQFGKVYKNDERLHPMQIIYAK